LTTVWRIGFCENPAIATPAFLAALGYGSTLGNSRWHVKGAQQVVYAASNRALCQLEKRVHCNGANPKNQALMQLEIPDDTPLMAASDHGLPADWQSNEAATQVLGLSWLASVSSLGLWVPSTIEPSEMNLLINPAHPEYLKILLTIERYPFQFDPRLFQAEGSK
jgi:RES domain-containing protein